MKSKKLSLKPPAAEAFTDIEVVRLVWLAIFVSVFSFLFYYRAGEILLYGDAVAHINIARRVFDSRTPGLLQLGTVWLPLPHLLILPFIISKEMWQSGSGGSIPSMAGFVLGVLGIGRLARVAVRDDKPDGWANIAGWAAVMLYAANPNLIYMQATAMGESLYLAFFIWAIVYVAEFFRGNDGASLKCGLSLMAASLTRYDGWFLAGMMVVVVSIRALRNAFPAKGARSGAIKIDFVATHLRQDRELRPCRPGVLWRFVLFAALGPLLWLGYNAGVYRNPLEFANGPYSAKAIELKTSTVNPAKGNLLAAGSYFLKAAELNVSESPWTGRMWVGLALLGSFAAWAQRRGRVLLLLWTPIAFYALSVAYGSVPIFLPTWWPFSIYNARYGLQLLPALAVFVPLGIHFVMQTAAKLPATQALMGRRSELVSFAGVLVLAVYSYAAVWRGQPIVYREAALNMRGRMAIDRQIGTWIKTLPPDSTLLMYLGEHVGALQQAGIPLQRTINEGNHRVWRQPLDEDGLWERALADPSAYADYVVGFQGDPAWNAATARHFTALVEIHTTGQPAVVVFQARAHDVPPHPR